MYRNLFIRVNGEDENMKLAVVFILPVDGVQVIGVTRLHVEGSRGRQERRKDPLVTVVISRPAGIRGALYAPF